MFEELSKESFSEREMRILSFWKQGKIFERSVIEREGKPLFSFYDGPPFATGLPHYGHLLTGTIKDVLLRYKTMKNFHVPRRFGWDCHGLPVENEIERTHNLRGAVAIEQYGIAAFNEECRKIVLRYSEEWRAIVERMGRWVNFDSCYKTMDLPYMESVWWVFRQLYDRGLIYEGYKVMPYSAALGTPLSNFEASENYKEVDDPSLVVEFKILDLENSYFLAWTTTPWTLVSNLALMVGEAIEYVKVKDRHTGKYYFLARATLPQHYKNSDDYEVIETKRGSDLASMRYLPLFPYFSSKAQEGAFRVIVEEGVSTEEGTGIVHCAPGFGELDFYACQREAITPVCPVNENGYFTEEVPEFCGLFVKDADKPIIKSLKSAGKLFHHSVVRHRYPFCWRSDTPLIYKTVTTWFVSVEKIKDALLASNSQINWMPAHLKEGRFGKWLEGARDWAVSRNRYWGTPIPIWRSEDGELIVLGSKGELEAATGCEISDLHRHHIDQLTISREGKLFKRIPEVFDCWFESGSMPYAQNHYPFENEQLFLKNFPADFIGEGLDQTRGWFYTLTVLSTALFQKPAFKNVIVNGIILAENGAKMSKRLRNYPDPQLLLQECGADAIRLYLMHSPAVRGEDLCFSKHGVELVLRQIMIPLWHSYSFFITYARLYEWKPSSPFTKPSAAIDRWLLSHLQRLIKDVGEGLDSYSLNGAVEPFVGYIEQLTNWYIRRCRRRFWSDEASEDRHQAFSTLYQVLLTLAKIAAPFVPFISEAIYLNLRSEEMADSVHLCDYPTIFADWRDSELEAEMAAVQTVVSLGHALRKEHMVKVRQPLGRAYIASPNPEMIHFLKDQQHLIAEELNVKEIQFSSDEKKFVSLRAKPNFRKLGKKVGKLMKAAHTLIDSFDQNQLEIVQAGDELVIELEGERVALTADDLLIERTVLPGLIAATEGDIVIALDTTLDETLLLEGIAREMVNKINSLRREKGLKISDRITLTLQCSERVLGSFATYRDYIFAETLAVDAQFAKCEGSEFDLNGEIVVIALQVVKGPVHQAFKERV